MCLTKPCNDIVRMHTYLQQNWFRRSERAALQFENKVGVISLDICIQSIWAPSAKKK